MPKRIEHGWAIVGDCGLYVGWRQSRVAMIAEHVSAVQPVSEPKLHPFAFGSRLNDEQSKAWQRCRKLGDRCVKVEIHYTQMEVV